MTGITASMKTFQGTLLILLRRLLAVVVFAAFSLAVDAEGVRAQTVYLSTNNVTIDLSVIENSGIGPAVETVNLIHPSGASRGRGLFSLQDRNLLAKSDIFQAYRRAAHNEFADEGNEDHDDCLHVADGSRQWSEMPGIPRPTRF